MATTGLLAATTPTTDYSSYINNAWKNTFGTDADASWVSTYNNELNNTAGGWTNQSAYDKMVDYGTRNGFTPKANVNINTAINSTPTNWQSTNQSSMVDEWFRNTLGRAPTAAELSQYNAKDSTGYWDPNANWAAFSQNNPGVNIGMQQASQLVAPNGSTTQTGANTGNSAQQGLLTNGWTYNADGTQNKLTGPASIGVGQVANVFSDAASKLGPLNASQISTAGLPQLTAGAVDPNSIKDVTAQKATATLAPSQAQTYQAQQLQMTDDMLMENRLNSIINKDNPLMQSARTSALQAMNGRGLLNSSMSAEAAQKAVIDSAAPIAAQDAQTTYKVAYDNQTAENRAREFSANAQNTRDIDNAKLATETELQNVRNELDAAVANQNTARSIELANAENALKAQIAVFDAEMQARTANAQMTNAVELEKYKTNANLAGQLANSLVDVMQGNQTAQNSWNQMTSNQQFSANQAYATAGSALTQQYNQQIQQIQMDSNMTTQQKQDAIDQLQNNQFPSAISMLNTSFSGLASLVNGISMFDIA